MLFVHLCYSLPRLKQLLCLVSDPRAVCDLCQVSDDYPVTDASLACRYGARISQDAVKSLRLCLQQMWRHEGIKGFYKGSLPSIIKAAPSAAVTFATYEFVIGYAATTMSRT